jgi:hypothetical protein
VSFKFVFKRIGRSSEWVWERWLGQSAPALPVPNSPSWTLVPSPAPFRPVGMTSQSSNIQLRAFDSAKLCGASPAALQPGMTSQSSNIQLRLDSTNPIFITSLTN